MISENVVRSVYNEIQKPLFYIFQQSFNKEIFLKKLGTAKITHIFKKKANQHLSPSMLFKSFGKFNL